MTQADKIKFNNIKAKLEKTLAKLDMVEQTNQELVKENERLKKNNQNLQEDITKKCNSFFDEIAKMNEKIEDFKAKKKEDSKTIKKLQNEIAGLKSAIEDFKASKAKDSTNSSKPSSTNGFKMIVQNNRTKSDRAKGGQKGRRGVTLEPRKKADKTIDVYDKKVCDCGGTIEYDKIESIKKQVIDLLNEVQTLEYVYHIGVCNKCGKKYIPHIPKEHSNPVQYSDKVKALTPLIKNISNTSVETTRSIFNIIFKGLPISTGWVHKQDENLANKCKPVYNNIKDYLTMVAIANADETSVKIDDTLGCCITFSNDKAVIYDMFSNKSKNSFDEFDIFNKFSGILVHDHNKTYYKYCLMEHAECNVHICRYLEGVIQIQHRNGAKKLKEFLLSIYKEKLDKLAEGQNGLDSSRLAEIKKQYLQIISEWENEYNTAIKKLKRISKTLKEEQNLFSRLREYVEEHLRFVNDFRVPFSNNAAERNLRSIKIKMNVSKRFGKLECAKNYSVIKSIIETAKRQGKDVVETFIEILNGNVNVFDLKTEA